MLKDIVKQITNYDPTKPSKYIEYLDKNSLYGWGMSGYLLYGGFKWLKNVDNFDVNLLSENSSIGYILEADLEYPLDYCKKIADKYRIKVGGFFNSKFR